MHIYEITPLMIELTIVQKAKGAVTSQWGQYGLISDSEYVVSSLIYP